MTCFDIILETEHARQKLNTKTAEPYFLREEKSGSAIRVVNSPIITFQGIKHYTTNIKRLFIDRPRHVKYLEISRKQYRHSHLYIRKTY